MHVLSILTGDSVYLLIKMPLSEIFIAITFILSSMKIVSPQLQ